MSRFCLHADRRLCLQASEEAAAKARAIEDEVFRALVLGSSASINLYLKGWREEDAALCLKAMQVTAAAKDHATLIRRDGIEGILECSRSRYQECRISATHGKKLSREVGDIYIFVLFNVMEFDRASAPGGMATITTGNRRSPGLGGEERQPTGQGIVSIDPSLAVCRGDGFCGSPRPL